MITALYTLSDKSTPRSKADVCARLKSVVGCTMQTALLPQPRAMFCEVCFPTSASLNDLRHNRSKLDICNLRLSRQASKMQGASISQHYACYKHNGIPSVLMSAAGGGEPHLTGVETSSAAAERDTGAHVSAQLFFQSTSTFKCIAKSLCCCRARLRLIKQQFFQMKACITCLLCPSARLSCHKKPSPSSSLSHVIGYCSS